MNFCFTQLKPSGDLLSACGKLREYWHAVANDTGGTDQQRRRTHAAATACLALLDTTLATGRRVGALLVRATAAAAGQQGAPGADWFQEACRILEDLEGLGSRSFETITAATQVVQPARSLPSLNTWRHVLTMLAAAALEALAWAQTLEAVVVLSPEELPHGLAEALLSPPGGYHAVDMLCCNFVVLLRELLPLLGQCSGRRSIDPLQDDTARLALKAALGGSARAVASFASTAALIADYVTPVAEQLDGMEFPDAIRIAETTAVLCASEAVSGSELSEEPDVVGDGVMPLMVACLFQTLYEKVIVGFQQATQPQSPFLTVKAGLAYFKDRYPAVMQAASPWTAGPNLQRCITTLRVLSAWPLGGGILSANVCHEEDDGSRVLQAMVDFQERVWQAAGKRGPAALPPLPLKQLVDTCAAVTGVFASIASDTLSCGVRQERPLMQDGAAMQALIGSLTLTLRCAVACVDRLVRLAQEDEEAGGEGAAGAAQQQGQQARQGRQDRRGGGSSSRGGPSFPPTVLPPIVQERALRESQQYMLQSLVLGMSVLLRLLQGGGQQRGGKQRKKQGRRGAQQRGSSQEGGSTGAGPGVRLPPEARGAAAALLEGLLRFRGMLGALPWRDELEYLTDDMLDEIAFDPEFGNDIIESDSTPLEKLTGLLPCLLGALWPACLPPAPSAAPAAASGAGSSSSSGAGGSSAEGPSLAALQGLTNSLTKVVPVWLGELLPGEGSARDVRRALTTALECCVTMVDQHFPAQEGGGGGGSSMEGTTRARDLGNTTFRILPAAAALAAASSEDPAIAQRVASCRDRLVALGVTEGMAADRTGVGCCYAGCTNLAGCEEAGLTLYKCTGCQMVRFCGQQCQRQAWGQHKAACRAAAAAAAGAAAAGGEAGEG